MKFIKAIAIIFISIIVLSAMIKSCDSDTTTATNNISSEIDTSSTTTNTVSDNNNWQYSDQEDDMTSKKTYYAQVQARELLYFKFPYKGGSTATLVIRNKGGENDVYVSVTKGQMLTRSYESTSYRVRFDDKPAERYPFIGPSDGSSTLAFINNTSKFIKKLKKSKKVIIEIEFYREGLNPIAFDVADLKWNH